MNTLFTNHAHRPVEAPPEMTSFILRRLDPLRPLRDSLSALGLAHVVSIQLSEAQAEDPVGTVCFTLVWTLPHGHRAQIDWSASADAFGDEDTLLSVAVRVTAQSCDAAPQVRAAWSLVGPILESLTARLFRAVAELAEELVESRPAAVGVPLTVAA